MTIASIKNYNTIFLCTVPLKEIVTIAPQYYKQNFCYTKEALFTVLPVTVVA